MPDLVIQSHRGPYQVRFISASPTGELSLTELEKGLSPKEHLIVDTRVAELYAKPLARVLAGASVLKIDAQEQNKSLERIPTYVTHLLEQGIKRDHTLVAIGGGIIQDIVAFLASCLLRGVTWRYYPTTLLAQADSCIGSKSSINVAGFKNIVGTFTPPQEVVIALDFLNTLREADLRSGIGEMIKVHIIAGWEDTRRIAQDYPDLLSDRQRLIATLRRSLEIKKTKIEIDEFDRKERLVMNYGHTFGHAIESATQYRIPHGIAVTFGMDIANRVSQALGLISADAVQEMRPMLQANYFGFEQIPVPEQAFFQALAKDKKNPEAGVSLILLRNPGDVFLTPCANDEKLRSLCREYFGELQAKVAV